MVGDGDRIVVGKPEIAVLLGVQPKTPLQWRRRNALPAPDHAPVNGRDAWLRSTIVRWAAETGRLPEGGV